jgi:hypothetical protein
MSAQNRRSRRWPGDACERVREGPACRRAVQNEAADAAAHVELVINGFRSLTTEAAATAEITAAWDLLFLQLASASRRPTIGARGTNHGRHFENTSSEQN